MGFCCHLWLEHFLSCSHFAATYFSLFSASYICVFSFFSFLQVLCLLRFGQLVFNGCNSLEQGRRLNKIRDNLAVNDRFSHLRTSLVDVSSKACASCYPTLTELCKWQQTILSIICVVHDERMFGLVRMAAWLSNRVCIMWAWSTMRDAVVTPLASVKQHQGRKRFDSLSEISCGQHTLARSKKHCKQLDVALRARSVS